MGGRGWAEAVEEKIVIFAVMYISMLAVWLATRFIQILL